MTTLHAAEEPVIRTPDQRLRVFVSSTLTELAAERAAVRTAIERLHLIPVMFELGARPHPPRTLYRAYLAQSHVFLGVYGERYGWVAPDEDVSGLEDEYRLSAGMPRLLYLREPAPAREPRLQRLLDRFSEDDRASYKHFEDAEELAALVEDDLAVLLTERFEAAATRMTGSEPTRPRHVDTAPPVPLTRTIGRDRAIGEVAGLVTGGTRLLTITGPGGTGKSRLALEVARRVGHEFPGGVHFVPLEPLNEPAGFLRAVADRLGVVGEPRRPLLDTLVEHLAGPTTLLVIDNFEHVIDAAPQLGGLLDRVPALRALVTSRRPLRLRGEHEHPLPPLEVPLPGARDPAEAAAVRLFVERARAVRPDFALTGESLPAIVALVRRLDGLPLAIELAAARTRLLPPAALLGRLEERLDLLSSGAVDLPERQRTLRATIGWSYALLDAHEQRLLDRLSVFAGGAALDAVEHVCADADAGDVLETLSSLLEKSLLVSTTEYGGEPQVQLLHTVRTFARERLHERGELPETADRHAAWFLDRVALVDPSRDPAAHARFEDLLAEVDDIRAAMQWVLGRGDLLRAAAFAHATWMWFWMTGRAADVLPWFEEAAAAVDDRVPARARAALGYALGQLREITGDPVGSEAVMAPAIALLRELGADQAVAGGLVSLAAGAAGRGRPEQALEHAAAALEIGERLGDDYVIVFAAANVGLALMAAGDRAGARAAHERSLHAARRSGFVLLEAQALGQLALLDVLDGDLAAAWDALRAAAARLLPTHNREGAGYWLETAGCAELAGGHPRSALQALRTAEAICDGMAMTIWPQLRPLHDRWVADAAAQLGGAGAEPVTAPDDPWQLIEELLAGDRPARAAA